MKLLGIIFSVVGFLLILLCLNMTVTVDKVYNTGLIADRSLWGMIGCTILICGCLLFTSRSSGGDVLKQNKIIKVMNGEPLFEKKENE